ncbi:GIY-YIG nuclease family protein [Bacillus toyonensis]|uniref:GIY-YIG nuclease family protein n=1 Tax=Bacillus toyonensis TaxID=155322 RepID=UPI003D302933
MELKVEELVYGDKGNETYLTLYFNKVEFKDLKKLQPRASVYLIYNHNDELLYIGETTNLKVRIRNHLSPNHGKEDINKDTLAYIQHAYLNLDRYERGIIEGILVQKYKPALNCDDNHNSDAKSNTDREVILDAMFYTKNTTIADTVIAKSLNMNVGIVRNIRTGISHSHIELPPNYVPTIKISSEFIENARSTHTHVTQPLFNEIREQLEKGVKNFEIARKYNRGLNTVARIKSLATDKYKKWEEQRTGKAVA